MKLVVGLGNPGRRYEQSRHNVGYSVVDELARRLRMDLTRYDRSFEGVVGEASAADQRLLLLKPATFMNCSGRSVAAVRSFYKLSPSDILVAYDDLDLEVGQIRLRAGGSGGGHRGMTDILKALDTADVPRLRIGIGKVHRSATVEYVLARFEPHERELIAAAVSTAADAIDCWLHDGITTAMNRFNRRKDDRDGDAASPPTDPRPQGDDT